jgi:hypothetical protein
MAAKKQSQICIMTVTGKDRVGIIAKLAGAMAKPISTSLMSTRKLWKSTSS